ncbi:MAG: hypothetical protein ACR2PG_01830 [Hyphomicrobiaceae bacterium]
MTINSAALADGAHNMLINCAEVTIHHSVLIIAEPTTDGYYDPGLVSAVAGAAEQLAARVDVLEYPFDPVVRDPSPELTARMDASDRVIFLARLGDQLRFRPSVKDCFSVMSYALDRGMLASPFGGVDYACFETLKSLINEALTVASEIHVTCPAGSDFRGPGAHFPGEAGETTVKRFPLSVFSPIPPQGFSGRIAQVGFLCATGSQSYDPPACELRDPLFIHFEENWITRFQGSTRDIAAAEAHYDHVAGLFDLERNFVHSWHAGIHPSCSYDRPANANFDRWSNGAFGNPRLLHFHTCGRHAPGEISLNIVDPTVRLDGVAVWENGQLRPERIKGGAALLASNQAFSQAFANPATAIGLGPSGQLQY